MDASLIIIGDEILLGKVVDTNTRSIARALEPYGIAVRDVVCVHDNAQAIAQAVGGALSRSSLVLTTGGLGPTKDDITKNVLMSVFGGRLVYSGEVYDNICRIFANKGLDLNLLTKNQAMVPSSCRVIQNHAGTAPVMWFETGDGRVLVSMPGVPDEVKHVLADGVCTAIAKKFADGMVFGHRQLTVTGISESALAEHLEDFEDALTPDLHLAYLPYAPIIKLRLDASGKDPVAVENNLDNAFDRLLHLTGEYLVDTGDTAPAQTLLHLLDAQNLTLATAESCTGGNIAAAVTSVPGSSARFMGGIVAYDNSAKTNLLGVSHDTLQQYGAVSAQTVEQMLTGACRALGTDCAIATSGIAGPSGGTPEKPVGTVWIGVLTPKIKHIECLNLSGSRQQITNRATITAILRAIKVLRS